MTQDSLSGPDVLWPARPHSATEPTDHATAVQACFRTDSAFAARSVDGTGAAEAFAMFAADDGVLLSDPELARGPAAIREAFAGFDAARELRWTPSAALGDGEGGLAFCVGESVNRPKAGREGRVGYGKYLSIFRLEPNARWAYLLDLGSPRPATP